MKKFIIALVAVVAAAVSASAQSTEIQVGYGGYTQMDATGMHGDLGKVKTAWGALNAGVNFRIAPNVWVGPSYSFSSTSAKHADVDVYYHVIMLNLRYVYYRTSIFSMYAHAGLGVDITHYSTYDSRNKGYLAFQASPLCFDAGVASGVSLFGELGFGAQGLVNVGVRFKL